jgi:UDP-N-acetylmuramyl pentapeptide synthase
VASELDADTNVLVKGSRFMQMERVVAALLDPQAERKEA